MTILSSFSLVYSKAISLIGLVESILTGRRGLYQFSFISWPFTLSDPPPHLTPALQNSLKWHNNIVKNNGRYFYQKDLELYGKVLTLQLESNTSFTYDITCFMSLSSPVDHSSKKQFTYACDTFLM